MLKAATNCRLARIVQIVRPLGAVLDAQGRVFDRLQQAFVKRKSRSEYRDGLVQARLGVLLEEVDAHAARQKEVDGIGTGGAQGGNFRGVVRLAQLGVYFAADSPLVVALESGQMVFTGRIVGRQQVDFLEPGVGYIFAHHFV